MKEFAQKGYKNASTDEIVKEAEISKGALFHYFISKKDLFLYLYDYAADLIKNEMINKYDFNEKDIFHKRRQLTQLKIQVLNRHPEMYDFLSGAYLETSTEVKGELDDRNKVLIAIGQKYMNEGIDESVFKDGVDAKKALEIINWTVEGFTKREVAKVKNFELYKQNFDDVLKELDIYLEILKNSFYK